MCPPGWQWPQRRPAGGLARGRPRGPARLHRQQGLRQRPQGRHPGGSVHPDRREPGRPRRRRGADVPDSLPPAEGPLGLSAGRGHGGGRDVPGWLHVPAGGDADGGDGGTAGGAIRDFPRRAGPVCAGEPPEGGGGVGKWRLRRGGGPRGSAGLQRGDCPGGAGRAAPRIRRWRNWRNSPRPSRKREPSPPEMPPASPTARPRSSLPPPTGPGPTG